MQVLLYPRLKKLLAFIPLFFPLFRLKFFKSSTLEKKMGMEKATRIDLTKVRARGRENVQGDPRLAFVNENCIKVLMSFLSPRGTLRMLSMQNLYF